MDGMSIARFRLLFGYSTLAPFLVFFTPFLALLFSVRSQEKELLQLIFERIIVNRSGEIIQVDLLPRTV